LRPNAQYSFIENDYSTIEWFNLEGQAPTAKEIADAVKVIEAEEASAAATAAAAKAALLQRLGITAEEAQLLLS